MSNNSGFKVVAVVAVLSILGVVVIDRLIQKGTFSSFYVSPANEAVPPVSEKAAPAKTARSRGLAPKDMASSLPIGEAGAMDTALGSPVASPITRQGTQRIAVGMDRSQLVAVFGLPTLRVIETHNGKVVERFIYIDRDRHTRTVTLLENGRAVRSNTEPYFGSENR